jgi:hypothetical protein
MIDNFNHDAKYLKQLVGSIRVPHTAFTQGAKRIKQGMENVVSGSPYIISMIGESRGGKTSLLNYVAQQFPRTRSETGLNVPIVYIRTPAKPTEKAMARRILRALGDPLPYSRLPEYDLTDKAQGLLKSCETKAIFMDEIQHFPQRWGQAVVNEAADWLKNLAEEANVLLILTGTPESIAMFNLNEQLKNRTYGYINLSKFDWYDAKSRAEFCGILKCFKNTMKEFSMPEIHEEELAFRFWIASEGLMGLLVKILNQATWDIVDDNSTNGFVKELPLAITLKDFENAYDFVNMEIDEKKRLINPFSANFEVADFSPKKSQNPKSSKAKSGKVNEKLTHDDLRVAVGGLL